MQRAMRFVLSGAVVTSSCYAVYLLLLAVHTHYLLANGLAWLFGLSLSYILNKNFTFGDTQRSSMRMLSSFALIYIGQFIVGTIGLAVLVEICGFGARIAYAINLLFTASFSFVFLSRLFAARPAPQTE
ncbi:GtrA family protein [Sphingobium sp. DEHP117]|uniref:GtrA family protein n=1 Tax=Sphingobium sp. DEHP117 TaxID=2993436 RepID=UPI0027D56128|nr:GtrA family protein [Sphingobium sp. DEHP117]MDQ4421303.1 GtrA family protein [Sphingobium sp. DEHP117]